jgi:hypothetical protein
MKQDKLNIAVTPQIDYQSGWLGRRIEAGGAEQLDFEGKSAERSLRAFLEPFFDFPSAPRAEIRSRPAAGEIACRARDTRQATNSEAQGLRASRTPARSPSRPGAGLCARRAGSTRSLAGVWEHGRGLTADPKLFARTRFRRG